MICKKCGNECNNENTYCSRCGANLNGIITKNGQPMKSCFSKYGLFNWHGRRNRKPYFLFSFFMNACLDLFIKIITPFVGESLILLFSYFLLLVIYMYIGMINTVKRGHDIGISGLITGTIVIMCDVGSVLLGFSGEGITTIAKSGIDRSIVIFILISMSLGNIQKIFLIFKKGNSGSNEYGPDPFEHSLEMRL